MSQENAGERGGMKIRFRGEANHLLLLCTVMAIAQTAGAQLPGVIPPFIQMRGSGFGLDAQPGKGMYHVFFQAQVRNGFAVMGQLISISSHNEVSGLVQHSLSIDSTWEIGLGLGIQLDSWSYGADFTLAFPTHLQVVRHLSEDSELMAFVRVTNRGQLREIQDRGEFKGGIEWTKRHAQGRFSVFWFWEYPQSWVQAQWTWRFDRERSVRFLAQPAPLCLGLHFGLVSRIGYHWIGTTYSNLLGLVMWNWRLNLRK